MKDNSKSNNKEIYQKVTSYTNNSNEDFNSVSNIELDRSDNSQQRSFKQDPLLKWLTRQEFKDSYRLLNPESKEFSWSSRNLGSRIDQIWITEELADGLYEAEIQEIDVYTNSNHKAAVAKMNLNHLIEVYRAAEIKRANHQRTIFLCEEATKED